MIAPVPVHCFSITFTKKAKVLYDLGSDQQSPYYTARITVPLAEVVSPRLCSLVAEILLYEAPFPKSKAKRILRKYNSFVVCCCFFLKKQTNIYYHGFCLIRFTKLMFSHV